MSDLVQIVIQFLCIVFTYVRTYCLNRQMTTVCITLHNERLGILIVVVMLTI